MPQSNWNKLHNTELIRTHYTRIQVLLRKGGLIDILLPEIKQKIQKQYGESLSQYVAEAFRRRLVEDGFIPDDRDE